MLFSYTIQGVSRQFPLRIQGPKSTVYLTIREVSYTASSKHFNACRKLLICFHQTCDWPSS